MWGFSKKRRWKNATKRETEKTMDTYCKTQLLTIPQRPKLVKLQRIREYKKLRPNGKLLSSLLPGHMDHHGKGKERVYNTEDPEVVDNYTENVVFDM